MHGGVRSALPGRDGGLQLLVPLQEAGPLGEPGGIWYRCQLGQLATDADARRLCSLIIEGGRAIAQQSNAYAVRFRGKGGCGER